ncbi:uncharacterized protein [Triticum aestivum]|uniref:uncharacterized protein isoform X2 n=1 Tax=Triticum aestivum TaxID=4565 RepID=UPI00098AAD53|nr:uncharacterized protein LOC123079347 isoform X2 [Triticum aestivum]
MGEKRTRIPPSRKPYFPLVAISTSSLTMKDVKLHHHSQLQYGPVRHEDLELQLFQFIFHMLFSTSTSSLWKKEISPTGASKVTCRAPPTRPQAARRVMPACHQPQLWLNSHGASTTTTRSLPLLLPSPCSPAYWRPQRADYGCRSCVLQYAVELVTIYIFVLSSFVFLLSGRLQICYRC